MLSGDVFTKPTKSPQSDPELHDWGSNLDAGLSTQLWSKSDVVG